STSGLPSTATIGFGMRSVSGRMRVPMPAASTIAVFGTGAILKRLQRRHVDAIPGVELRQRRMRQRALQIGPYARKVTQILRFVVAPLQPREDAENFRGALRGQRRIEAHEGWRVESGVGGEAHTAVA